MGPDLSDGMIDEDARPTEWRTAPLVGLRFFNAFLHDGRAHGIEEAILAHEGRASEGSESARSLPRARGERPQGARAVRGIAMKARALITCSTIAWIAGGGLACKKESARDVEQEARVEREMKQLISQQVDEWLAGSRELYEAAPTPDGRGWDAQKDAAAIAKMKSAWTRARVAYELVEGALAPLFPESDTATDARYDDYLSLIGAAGDPTPFDDQGVIGMHGIERVLWSDRIPAEVVEFEKGVPGYRAATFPQNEQDAKSFRLRLAKRLVTDVEKLRGDLAPVQLDVAFAFDGLVDLAGEQIEKIDRASTGQEESRYAQATLRDLRANRQGCLDAYQVFRPWVLARAGGNAVDASVLQAFERLKAAYDAAPGDAIPGPPARWSSLTPKPEDLNTPFGRLFTTVKQESDEARPGSLRASLTAVAELLGLPKVLLRRSPARWCSHSHSRPFLLSPRARCRRAGELRQDQCRTGGARQRPLVHRAR